MSSIISISDDICDICRKPGFLEHTDCLLKFTGSLFNDVFASMDNDTFLNGKINITPNAIIIPDTTDMMITSNTNELITNNINTTTNTTINNSTNTVTNTTINNSTISTKEVHKLICRVPVQYYDQFQNKIYYKANSKKLKNIKSCMKNDPNFQEIDTNYNGYIKNIQITIEVDHPKYWYIHVTTIVKDLNDDKLPTIFKSLNDGLQTTLAMYTTQFTGPFEFVSYR